MKLKIIIAAAGASVLVGTITALVLGAFGSPIVSLCDQACRARTQLEQRAAVGDIAATNTLFKRSKELGLNTEAERYAMDGAFAGDPSLQAEYFQRWVQLEADDRTALLHAFERSHEGATAECYLAQLKRLSLDRPCPAGLQQIR
jgi:hypothetical protein